MKRTDINVYISHKLLGSEEKMEMDRIYMLKETRIEAFSKQSEVILTGTVGKRDTSLT